MIVQARESIERDQIVRERAYAIWESEGRPDGRAVEHWLKAEDAVAAAPGGASAAPAVAAPEAPRASAVTPPKRTARKAAGAPATKAAPKVPPKVRKAAPRKKKPVS